MSRESVFVEIDGRVATVTLDRASSGNAVSEQMAFELRDACDRLDRDDEVWVAVITGKGDAFCRGSEPPSLGPGDDTLGKLSTLRVAARVAALEKPVIAALNGDAMDQGLELALACDIRIAPSGARLGLTQVKRGVMPWDGGTQRLPRLVGRSRAMEMVLTSRVLESQEALEAGMVNEVVEPDQVLPRAIEIAAKIAGHGPIAARYLKEAVLKGADMTLEQGLRLEADLNFILQSTADRAEGIRSFLERRHPDYRGE